MKKVIDAHTNIASPANFITSPPLSQIAATICDKLEFIIIDKSSAARPLLLSS